MAIATPPSIAVGLACQRSARGPATYPRRRANDRHIGTNAADNAVAAKLGGFGTELDNANSRRVRYVVLESGSAGLKQWKSENRDVNADFRKLFRDESPNGVPGALTSKRPLSGT